AASRRGPRALTGNQFERGVSCGCVREDQSVVVIDLGDLQHAVKIVDILIRNPGNLALASLRPERRSLAFSGLLTLGCWRSDCFIVPKIVEKDLQDTAFVVRHQDIVVAISAIWN